MRITGSYSEYLRVCGRESRLLCIIVTACRDEGNVFIIGILNGIMEKARIGVIAEA
ncbi:hypothetical protein D3C85_1891240 [compost metagenome]